MKTVSFLFSLFLSPKRQRELKLGAAANRDVLTLTQQTNVRSQKVSLRRLDKALFRQFALDASPH